MLGWAITFFVLALVAAIFGFGGISTAFAGIATLLFWIFVVLFVLSLLLTAIGARHGGRIAGGARTVFTVVGAAAIGALIYAWVDEDWTAERMGRAIDRNTAEIASDIGEGLDTAGERTEAFVQNTSTELRDDAAGAFDEAEENIDPDNSEQNN